MFHNVPTFLSAFFTPSLIKNLYTVHRNFSYDPDYRFRYLVNTGYHMLKHNRLTKHEGQFIINSFLPPLNSRAYLTMLNAVEEPRQDIYKNHCMAKTRAPISLYIQANSACPYKCWHCSAVREQQGRDMTTEELLRTVKIVQNFGVSIIGFTGGEPLLRSDLEKVITSLDDRSVSFIFSTGYGLTYERAKAFKTAGLLGIAISLDSVDANEHDRKRGFPGAFKQAVKALEVSKEAGLYTMTQTVASRDLLANNGLEVLARFAQTLGVDEMRIIEPLPCGRMVNTTEYLLKDYEREQLIEFHKYCNAGRSLPKAAVFCYFESAEQYGCGAGVQHSYLDSSGNLYPCDFVPMNFGNVLEKNLAQIWTKMRDSIGLPHKRCFCSICFEKDKISKLPLDKVTAEKLCHDHQSTELPGFYQRLAGRN